MKHHQQTVGKSDTWITPRWILDALGVFDLDPCAAEAMPWLTARTMLTERDDGLSLSWSGRVWCNPPFNRYQRPKWMARMAEHGNGILLVPAACETDAFAQYVWGRAAGLLMLNRRPHFCDTTGREASANSGCTICLVAYGLQNLQRLRDSGLGTTLVVA